MITINFLSCEFLCHLGIIAFTTGINCKMTVARAIVLKSPSNPCDYLCKYSITKIQLSFNQKKSRDIRYSWVHSLFKQLLYNTYFACVFVALELSSSPALFVFPCSNAAQCMLLWI